MTAPGPGVRAGRAAGALETVYCVMLMVTRTAGSSKLVTA